MYLHKEHFCEAFEGKNTLSRLHSKAALSEFSKKVNMVREKSWQMLTDHKNR